MTKAQALLDLRRKEKAAQDALNAELRAGVARDAAKCAFDRDATEHNAAVYAAAIQTFATAFAMTTALATDHQKAKAAFRQWIDDDVRKRLQCEMF